MTQGDTKIAHTATAGDGGRMDADDLGQVISEAVGDMNEGEPLTAGQWRYVAQQALNALALTDAQPKAARPLGDEAVDWHRLDDLFAKIPSGPWDAHRTGGGHEVRQLDTDPTNKHHWPFRLCQSVAGQRAQCDDAVFDFIAGVLNAWPQISTAVADAEVNRILGLSGDELRAEIIADGDNPDQMVADLDAKVSSTLEMFGRMQRAEAALHQISSQYFDNRGDMTDAEALEAIAFLAKSALASHPTTGQETVATPRDGVVRDVLLEAARICDRIAAIYAKDDPREGHAAGAAADAIREHAALSAPGSAGPGEARDDEADDLLWLRGQIFALCEDTEDKMQVELEKPDLIDHARGFHKGRAYEAKGIRRTIAEVVRCRLADRATPSPAQEPGTGDTGETVEAWKRVARGAGVCMTCAITPPEPIGCTDCLNTGWDGGCPDGFVPETGALADIAAERRRQIEAEGWTPEHDDAHSKCEMAVAAACYALAPSPVRIEREWVYASKPPNWPWDRSWWKPGFYRRNLVKAGALVVAEIERWDRATPATTAETRGPAEGAR